THMRRSRVRSASATARRRRGSEAASTSASSSSRRAASIFDAGGRIVPFVPRDSGGSGMKVEIKDQPEMRVAAVRHVGPYNQIPEAFERLGRIAGPAGLLRPGNEMIAIYHDDPESTPVDQLRSDAAISVPRDAKLPSDLSEQRVPAGRYACTLHVGPYEQLGDSWARLMGEWLPASGHRVGSGVSYERYLNNPLTEPDKEKLLTEMCVPIE